MPVDLLGGPQYFGARPSRDGTRVRERIVKKGLNLCRIRAKVVRIQLHGGEGGRNPAYDSCKWTQGGCDIVGYRQGAAAENKSVSWRPGVQQVVQRSYCPAHAVAQKEERKIRSVMAHTGHKAGKVFYQPFEPVHKSAPPGRASVPSLIVEKDRRSFRCPVLRQPTVAATVFGIPMNDHQYAHRRAIWKECGRVKRVAVGGQEGSFDTTHGHEVTDNGKKL